MEIGDFGADGQLARLREKLAELKLADHATERIEQLPGWYLVYLPPVKSRALVEQRVEQLHAQGVRDLLIVQDNGALSFTISLGSFREKELARKHLAQLERRGVRGVQVSETPTFVQITRVRIRPVSAASITQLEALRREFPQQKVQPCGPEATP